MKPSEKNLDQQLKDKLQHKFAGFEGEVEPDLYKKILKALTSSRYNWEKISVAALLVLLLTGFLLYLTYENPSSPSTFATQRNHELPTQALDEAPPGNSHSTNPRSAAPLVTNKKSLPESVGNARMSGVKSKNTVSRIVSSTTRNLFKNGDGTTRSAQGTNPVILGGLQPAIHSHSKEKTELSFPLAPAMPVPFTVVPLNFIVPTIASYRSVLPSSEESPIVKDPRSTMHWMFSASVLQSYQRLTVRSEPAQSYQNIRFSPLLSPTSLGYKLSAGFQRGSFQWLVNYRLLRSQTTYEIGIDKFDLRQSTGSGNYVITQQGEAQTKRENLHMLGIEVRKQLPLQETFLKRYVSFVGVEVSSILPTGQSMLWATASLSRPFSLTPKINLSIGPYVEYGFSSVSSNQDSWQSKPYQVGISVFIRNTHK